MAKFRPKFFGVCQPPIDWAFESNQPVRLCLPDVPRGARDQPVPCPKCGMALEPESRPTADDRVHCPMHPEIVRPGPGSCPICGMALEPRTVTVHEEENPELRNMTRRFWISVILTIPLLAVAMGSMLWPHAFMGGLSLGGRRIYDAAWQPWLELMLATPVVLWGGWPFFQRGWASIVNHSTNMFTLIAMGTGVAYVYSLIATVFPQLFPASFRTMGDRPDVYFEAAASSPRSFFSDRFSNFAPAARPRAPSVRCST